VHQHPFIIYISTTQLYAAKPLAVAATRVTPDISAKPPPTVTQRPERAESDRARPVILRPISLRWPARPARPQNPPSTQNPSLLTRRRWSHRRARYGRRGALPPLPRSQRLRPAAHRFVAPEPSSPREAPLPHLRLVWCLHFCSWLASGALTSW